MRACIFIWLMISFTSLAQDEITLVPQRGLSSHVTGSVFGPSEKTIITYNEHLLSIWNVNTGLQFGEFNSEYKISQIAYYDENTFLIAYEFGRIELRDLYTTELLHSVDAPAPVTDIHNSIIDSGKVYIAANGLFVLDPKDFTLTNINPGAILIVDQSSTSGHLFCIDANGNYLEMHQSGEMIRSIPIRKRIGNERIKFTPEFFKYLEPKNFAFSADGKMLYFITGERIFFFNLTDKTFEFKESTYYFGEKFTAITIHPSENKLIASTDRNYFYVYDTKQNKFVKTLTSQHVSELNHVTMSPSGKCFASSSDDYSSFIWENRSMKVQQRLYSKAFQINAVAISKDGNKIVMGDDLGSVYTTSFEADHIDFQHYRVSLRSIADLAFFEDQNRVIIGSKKNQLTVLNMKNRKLLSLMSYGGYIDFKGITSSISMYDHDKVNVSPSGFVSTSCTDKKPWIIDTEKEERIKKLDFGDAKKSKQGIIEIEFSPDETQIAIIFKTQFMRNRPFTTRLMTFNIAEDGIFAAKDIQLQEDIVSVDWKDNQSLIYQTEYGKIYQQKINDPEPKLLFDTGGNCKFYAEANRLVHQVNKELFIYEAGSYDEAKIIQSPHRITDFDVSFEGNRVVLGHPNGFVTLWNLSTQKLILTLYPVERNNLILTTPDNYYLSYSKEVSGLGFRLGDDIYPPAQFDLKYNRPDLIYKALEYKDTNLIRAYHSAYERRLKKLGFTEEMLLADFNVPEVKLKNEIPFETNTSTLKVQIEGKDQKYHLDRINIWVNNVAIHGRDGINIRDKNTKNLTQEVEIPLAKGKNWVEISVLNEGGVESYKESFEITCNSGKNASDLYILAMGVSNYQNSQYNLNFAAKDARDIVQTFEESKFYNHVHSKLLTDEQVTLKNINDLKTFFAKADINDQVIVFIAGHGVRDHDFSYYFAGYDMDFSDPSKYGIPYTAIEALLDGIKPLKKLLLMDTCHSGEMDEEDVKEVEEDIEEDGEITFRKAGSTFAKKENQFGIRSTSELLKNSFSDLRKGTGATVIASAGGVEFAFESADWKNGLFTYCLLNGLKNKTADLNKDKMITISELQEYVQESVFELSGGKQSPTSRIENNLLDYQVW